MDWLRKVTNEYPKNLIFIYIQNGRAMHRSEAWGLIETERVIGFLTAEEAQYFISNYDPKCIDYTDCCIKGKTIYIFNSNNCGGYYCDDINT